MTSKTSFAFGFESDPDARVVVISLVGKLDPMATEELTPRVEEAFQAGARRFVFDLSRLDYVGSLGLRLFVALHNRVRGQGAVALSNPTAPVLTILDMTKLNRVLRHYPTRHEAVDATNV
ncbi:MAG: STAS domain-containing protein [Planctomycetes bacterium]|nr:STAS domain-containing protein [Planctomycetota bacterium]